MAAFVTAKCSGSDDAIILIAVPGNFDNAHVRKRAKMLRVHWQGCMMMGHSTIGAGVGVAHLLRVIIR
eukprot:2087291-Rhodomonas_salina.2